MESTHKPTAMIINLALGPYFTRKSIIAEPAFIVDFHCNVRSCDRVDNVRE